MDLLDPLQMSDSDWPSGSHAVRAYAEAFCRWGSQRFVANVRTRLMILRDDSLAVPVTINDAEYENSYVCSPYARMKYMRDELHLTESAALRAAGALYADASAVLMKLARFNKVIHINNWLFDMNTYPEGWVPDVDTLIATVTDAFPEHFICFNSLNEWSNGELMSALTGAGFSLCADRQTYVFDDLQKTVTRKATRKDLSMLRGTSYRAEEEDTLSDEDFGRLAELYYLAYCQKHSLLNPVFTAEFMRAAHGSGLMRFVCLRAADGRIDAFQAFFTAYPGSPSSPFAGWDPAIDREHGLYRMITAIMFDTALREGWTINDGDSNAMFKRIRGAKPHIDYKANYCRHLSLGRRLMMAAFTQVSNRIFAPTLEKLEV